MKSFDEQLGKAYSEVATRDIVLSTEGEAIARDVLRHQVLIGTHCTHVCNGHGVVLEQCRCPAQFKSKTVLPCPEGAEHDEAVVRSLRQLAREMARDLGRTSMHNGLDSMATPPIR